MTVGPAGWSRRLHAVLGVLPHRLGVAHLDTLVNTGVRHADDRAFNEGLYGNSDAERWRSATRTKPSGTRFGGGGSVRVSGCAGGRSGALPGAADLGGRQLQRGSGRVTGESG